MMRWWSGRNVEQGGAGRRLPALLMAVALPAAFLTPGATAHGATLRARSASASSSALPRFQYGPCPIKPGRGFTAGTNPRCGTLFVEADHQHPGAGVFRLAVAIFRTPSPYRMPDPVVYLSGGPGYGALDNGSGLSANDAPDVLGNHDLILIDQRGTGYSQPHPNCIHADAPGGRAPTTNAAYNTYLQNCHARLDRLGESPTFFRTRQSADDIHDLRTALNLPPIDLYGISYGTTLALEVMRRHSADLRSVVLDAVVPFGFASVAGVSAESRGFHALFVGCSRSPHCRKTYPNLKRTFHTLLVNLNRHPAVFITRGKRGRATKHQMDANDFAELIRELLYDTESLPQVPGLISDVSKGNYRALPHYFNQTNQYFAGDSAGDYRSVTCAEDVPLDTPARVKAALATLPAPLKPANAQGLRDQAAECRAWNVPAVGQHFYSPVVSTVPTLLMTGEYDPIATPGNARRVAATLPHSYNYVFPGTGHGVRYTAACPDRMVNEFYDVPTQAPASGCIAHMREPF